MKDDVIANIAQSLGKLMTSAIVMQRAIAIAFYAELVGKVDCGTVWLEVIINTLHEAKADSSSLVRKLATIGLGRIAYLHPKQVKISLRCPNFAYACFIINELSFRLKNILIIVWMLCLMG